MERINRFLLSRKNIRGEGYWWNIILKYWKKYGYINIIYRNLMLLLIEYI